MEGQQPVLIFTTEKVSKTLFILKTHSRRPECFFQNPALVLFDFKSF